MKRKYPAKMFLLFVLTNFLFRFFYLFIPGTVLCVVGIWSQTYLYVGLAVLGLDLILSIVEQVRIRNAAVGQSENPDFNEKMDKLMEHEAPWDKIIFEYYMNFIPYFSNLFSP